MEHQNTKKAEIFISASGPSWARTSDLLIMSQKL